MPDHFLEEMCYFYQNLLCNWLSSENNQQVISADSESFSEEMTKEYVTPVNYFFIQYAAVRGLDDQQSSRKIFDRQEDWVIPQGDTFWSLNQMLFLLR